MSVLLRWGHGKHNGVRAPAGSVPNLSKLWVASVFPQVLTETMIEEQESNRALKGVKRSLPINNSDAEEKTLKIRRALNNLA